MREGTAQVWTEYHQFFVRDQSSHVGVPVRELAGLAGVIGDGGLVIFTGIAIGTVTVTWSSHEGSPPPEIEGWDDVVEVVADAPRGRWFLTGFDGGSVDDVNLLSQGPRSYTVRVSARGRDAVWDGEGQSTEEIHLDVWPTPAGGTERVLKAGSAIAGWS